MFEWEGGMCADSRVKLIEINTSSLGLADLTQIQILWNQLRGCSFTSDWHIFVAKRVSFLLRETRSNTFAAARRFIESSSKLLNDERDVHEGSLCARRKPQIESTTWEATWYHDVEQISIFANHVSKFRIYEHYL